MLLGGLELCLFLFIQHTVLQIYTRLLVRKKSIKMSLLFWVGIFSLLCRKSLSLLSSHQAQKTLCSWETLWNCDIKRTKNFKVEFQGIERILCSYVNWTTNKQTFVKFWHLQQHSAERSLFTKLKYQYY